MNEKQFSLRVSSAVRDKIREVKNVLRRYVLVQTCLMMVICILFLFWLGGVIDYLPVTLGSDETPNGFRAMLLIGIGAGILLIFVGWCLPRLLVQLKDSSIALLIEKHHPHLENRLLTAVELGEPAANSLTSSEQAELAELEVSDPAAYKKMLQRVHTDLDCDISSVDAKSLFDWQPVVAATVSVSLSLLITLFACFAMPFWMSLWSKRLFTLSDELWPRRAELRLEGLQLTLPSFSGQVAPERVKVPFSDGIARLPKGAAALLQVSANAEGRQVPEVCTLYYDSADGSRGRANLRRIGRPEGGWQQFALDGPPLDGLTQDMQLSVVGLDARIRDQVLKIVDPPLLKGVKLECHYPKYLDSISRADVEVLQFRSGMQIPEGSRLFLLGEASTDLSLVQYSVKSTGGQIRKFEAESAEVSTSEELVVNQNDENTAASFEIFDVAPSKDAPSLFRIDLGLIQSNLLVEIRLLDQYELASDQVPRFAITVQPDNEPEVESKLVGIGKAVTPNAVLPIQATITDDHAVRSVVADLVSGESKSLEVDLDLPEQGKLETELDLQSLSEEKGFQLAAGDALGFVVAATDFFDLTGTNQIGRGQPQQLSVVTSDQLLVFLDRDELAMRKRLELIITEVEQLRSALQGIVTLNKDSSNRKNLDSVREVLASVVQEDPEDEISSRRRMIVLRAQQSVLQADKSQQELLGVANGVLNLKLQLENNRIDSYDRQERLQNKVYQPLKAVLGKEVPGMQQALLNLQNASENGGMEETEASIAAVDEVLIKLYEIKENMMDIESFNEIIDLVRGLLEEQDSLLKKTEKAKRDKLLKLLE